ncbi:type II toxin-antitoxin system VapC family toxin [Myxacorys almedinensis]|nr:PIN domain-containing protein [Myxacorys almedinensis]
MTQVLVDTSALIAFFVGSEKHHSAVKSYFLEHRAIEWVILSSVFDETVTWLRLRVSVSASIEIGSVLRQEHRYIALSEADDQAIWEAFCRYDDKLWSYTDCSLLVMAQRLGIFEIVSFDQHIRQMAGLGVVCLP